MLRWETENWKKKYESHTKQKQITQKKTTLPERQSFPPNFRCNVGRIEHASKSRLLMTVQPMCALASALHLLRYVEIGLERRAVPQEWGPRPVHPSHIRQCVCRRGSRVLRIKLAVMCRIEYSAAANVWKRTFSSGAIIMCGVCLRLDWMFAPVSSWCRRCIWLRFLLCYTQIVRHSDSNNHKSFAYKHMLAILQ